MSVASAPGKSKLPAITHTDYLNTWIQKRINGVARAIEFKKRIQVLEAEIDRLKSSEAQAREICEREVRTREELENKMRDRDIREQEIREQVIREQEIREKETRELEIREQTRMAKTPRKRISAI